MTTYIIGDLHANVRELERLIGSVSLTREDHLVFLGDLIDKGSETEATLRMLGDLRATHRVTLIKGNHEYAWERYLLHEEIGRKEFIIKYGGSEAVRLYPHGLESLERGDIPKLREILSSYLDLVSSSVDYFEVGDFLALHAGLAPEQLDQSPLVFTEANYFIRPGKMEMERKYLGRYRLVAGHTHESDVPQVHPGLINIDLGAGYGKTLGAFSPEQMLVHRSDGAKFEIDKCAASEIINPDQSPRNQR